jgi:hypothetical protein
VEDTPNPRFYELQRVCERLLQPTVWFSIEAGYGVSGESELSRNANQPTASPVPMNLSNTSFDNNRPRGVSRT